MPPKTWTIWVYHRSSSFQAYSSMWTELYGYDTSGDGWFGPYRFTDGEARNLVHAKRLAEKKARAEVESA